MHEQENTQLTTPVFTEKQLIILKKYLTEGLIRRAQDEVTSEENRAKAVRKIGLKLANKILEGTLEVEDFNIVSDILPKNFLFHSKKGHEGFLEYTEK